MKKANFQITALALLAIGLSLNLFWACSKDKLFKDVNVYIRADIMLNPLTIEITDANPANGAIPLDKVKVEILGPARDKIYSVLGERSLKLDGPFLNIGIRRFDKPSIGQPVYFGVRLTAPNYGESLRWYALTDGETHRVARQQMVKLDAPPAGVTVVEKTFQVKAATGTANDLTLETTLSAGAVPQKAMFTIPAGTKVYAEGDPNTPLEGNVRVAIVQYNTLASENFPTGSFTPYILESNGKPRKPGSSAPAGYTNVNMTVGGTPVGTFSNPIQATIVMDGEEDNPDTGKPVVAGDTIPIWSLTEPDMVWQKENRVALTEVNGELHCTWPMPHLSWWNAGWFPPANNENGYQDLETGNWIPPSINPTTLLVHSEIQPDTTCGTGGGFFYTEIYANTLREQLLYSDYWQYYDGNAIPLGQMLGGIPEVGVTLKIFSGGTCGNGQLLYTSPLITGGNVDLDINNALPNDGLNVSLLMEGTCGDGSVIIPSVPVFYRLSGAACFQALGELRVGVGCTGNLYKGSKYDFAVYFGGLQHIVDGITIPQGDTTIVLNGLGGYERSDTLFIQYTGENGNRLHMDYRNVQIPDDLCEEFRKYFD